MYLLLIILYYVLLIIAVFLCNLSSTLAVRHKEGGFQSNLSKVWLEAKK